MPAKTLLFVMLAMAFALPVDDLQNAHRRFAKLESSGSVGKFWMELAQLHSDVAGPLDDLRGTLSQFYDKLQGSFNDLDGEYSRKRDLHDKTLQSYTMNQQDAQIDIAQSQDQLDNFLLPSKDNINRKIGQIKQNILDNRKNLNRDKLEREKQRNNNFDNIQQHASATTAIDEALQLVTGLSNGNIAFSEAPLKKTINFIESKLDSKSQFAPMVEALIGLAGGEDTKALRDLLNKLRKSIVDSQIQLTENENSDQKMYEDRQKQLDFEYREFQTQLNQGTYDLTSIMARIDQEKEFIKSRKNDLAMYEDQIEMENSNFAAITGLYNDVRNQRLKEVKVVEDALNFASSSQFRELLQSKNNK